jgi:glutamine amidotransferase
MIGILDYGAGNLASVRNAFAQLGLEAVVFDHPELIGNFERIIVPGVGSFRLAMEALESAGWPDALRSYAASGKPILGICLGMQLLFDKGYEHGETLGLGLVPGEVVLMTPEQPYKVPHVGWNSLIHVRQHPLFKGVKGHVDFYFVHSYRSSPREPENIVAMCDYAGEFVAVVSRDNVVGMQFHPEKSQPAGLRILKNFAEWDGAC